MTTEELLEKLELIQKLKSETPTFEIRCEVYKILTSYSFVSRKMVNLINCKSRNKVLLFSL